MRALIKLLAQVIACRSPVNGNSDQPVDPPGHYPPPANRLEPKPVGTVLQGADSFCRAQRIDKSHGRGRFSPSGVVSSRSPKSVCHRDCFRFTSATRYSLFIAAVSSISSSSMPVSQCWLFFCFCAVYNFNIRRVFLLGDLFKVLAVAEYFLITYDAFFNNPKRFLSSQYFGAGSFLCSAFVNLGKWSTPDSNAEKFAHS